MSVYYSNQNLHKCEVILNQDITTKPKQTLHGVKALDSSQQKELQKQNKITFLCS